MDGLSRTSTHTENDRSLSGTSRLTLFFFLRKSNVPFLTFAIIKWTIVVVMHLELMQ